MSIMVLRKKERKAIPYDGSTMEKALAWSSVSSSGSSGKLTGMTYDSASSMYVAWVAVQLIATQEYTSSFGSWDGDCVELYDSSGTKLAYSYFDEEETFEMVPLSYTPSTSGTYYLKFKVYYWDSEYYEYEGGMSIGFSPRPADPDRPLYLPYETCEGVGSSHRPMRFDTAEDAGIRFDGTPIVGRAAIDQTIRKALKTLPRFSYPRLEGALEDNGISLYKIGDDNNVVGETITIGGKDVPVMRFNQGSGAQLGGFRVPTSETIFSAVMRFRMASLPVDQEMQIFTSRFLRLSLNHHGSTPPSFPYGVSLPDGLHLMYNTNAAMAFPRVCNATEHKILYDYTDDSSVKHYSWTRNSEHNWDEDSYYFEICPERYVGTNAWHTIAASYTPLDGGIITRDNVFYGGTLCLAMDGELLIERSYAANQYVAELKEASYIWLATLQDGGSSRYGKFDLDFNSLRFYTRPLNRDELARASWYK